MWRWSQRNPKLVGAATAGLLLGAAAVWLFRGQFFQPSQFNPPDRSIVVLPFTDSSQTKDQEYLCDGISEDILHTLAKVDGLRVVGRTSAFSLKGKNAKEVGEKLNVANVLEGSLQRQGKRVRVTADLIDARNGFRVWTETFDRELEGAFALQDEIARSIVDALKVRFAVRLPAHDQPGTRLSDPYEHGVFTDLTHPTGTSSFGVNAPLQNPSNPLRVPDNTSPEGFDQSVPDTEATAAPSQAGSTNGVRYLASEGLRTNKIKPEISPAPPEAGSTTSVRRRAPEAGLRTNKITVDVTPVPPPTGVATSVRSRAAEAGLQTNKITADGPTSIQGFVKNAKGEPIKGADLRIESRDSKQVSSTKTDSSGRYISQALRPGVYRVTLLVNGAAKASIMNTQTKANQPTQLNFDFKPTSQAGNSPKRGKHMVWMPSRTGSHIGGNWVEVDESGNQHSGSNIQTYSARDW
jgi:TolB-like protein